MKKTPQILIALTLAVATFALSCGKNYEPGPGPTPVATDKSQLNTLFKSFRSTPEIKCVTAGMQQTVVFSKGTKLTFYPNSFRTATGSPITSGTVCLEVIEMYKPGEMIANRAATTYHNELLISGGQVYIKATKDGQEVYANKYGIGFRQPSASTQPMRLFYGNTNNEDSVTTWTTDTTVNNIGNISESTVRDTTGISAAQGWYYQFDSCTDFNWINCDFFRNNNDPKTNITINTSDTTFNRKNTTVFIVFPTLNSVSIAYSYTALNSFIGPNFPIGMSFNIIVLAKKNGEYYYEEQTGLTVTANAVINSTPTKQTEDYIKNKLSNM